jgi:translation elongation factor EF-4
MHEIYGVKEWDDTVKIENISKEMVLAYFKSITQKCFGGTEKRTKKLVIRDNVGS